MTIERKGGRRSAADDPGPFKPGVKKTEADLLAALNQYRVRLGWSSRRLDDECGSALDLTTIIRRNARTKTATIYAVMDAMGLELVLQVKSKPNRLDRAIASKKASPSAEPDGGPEQ